MVLKKETTIYSCEYCGQEYDIKGPASDCERSHSGIADIKEMKPTYESSLCKFPTTIDITFMEKNGSSEKITYEIKPDFKSK